MQSEIIGGFVVLLFVVAVFALVFLATKEESKAGEESREAREKLEAERRLNQEHSERQAAAERERVLAEKIEAFKNAFGRRAIDLGLTCQCGKLALPIPGTSDRYRCSECANQFVGAKHDLPYFEDALKKALG